MSEEKYTTQKRTMRNWGIIRGVSCTAIAKAYERYRKDLQESREMKKEMDRIEKELSNVRPCPYPSENHPMPALKNESHAFRKCHK